LLSGSDRAPAVWVDDLSVSFRVTREKNQTLKGTLARLRDSSKQSMLIEALRGGAHEFLLKPTSPKAVQDRLVLIIARPRPMVQIGKVYVPKPCAGAVAGRCAPGGLGRRLLDGVDAVWIKRQIAGDLFHRRERLLIAPDRVLRGLGG